MTADDEDLGPGGYRIIEVPNTLRAKVGPGKGVDPARLKEAARVIENLSDSFIARIKQDLASIDEQVAIFEGGADPDAKAAAIEKVFSIVHELRGEAGTFGYGLASRIGNMLCVYIDSLPQHRDADARIVRHHCDSLRAIVAGGIKGDGGDVGQALLNDLHALVRRLA